MARPPVQSAVLEIPDIREEVERRGLVYGLKLLATEHRRATVADRLLIPVGARASVLALTCLHSAGSRPFALEQRLISLVAVPQAAEIDFAKVPPGTWLLQHVPWNEATHEIAATRGRRRPRRDAGHPRGPGLPRRRAYDLALHRTRDPCTAHFPR